MHFGFEFRVVGKPAHATVTLQKTTVYPAGGVRSPQASAPLEQNNSIQTVKIGEVGYTGYRLDDDWGMVPGEWHIQIWSGDRKLADQPFTLIAE